MCIRDRFSTRCGCVRIEVSQLAKQKHKTHNTKYEYDKNAAFGAYAPARGTVFREARDNDENMYHGNIDEQLTLVRGARTKNKYRSTDDLLTRSNDHNKRTRIDN